ncbi:hypothetical protein GCM10009738_56900 [Kitasatospora viridis]|nr:Tellurium resistance [Kitasatospora viridis]
MANAVWEFLRGERHLPEVMMSQGGKVTLTKSSPAHAITTEGPMTGNLYVNLHWSARLDQGSQGQLRRKLLQPRLLRQSDGGGGGLEGAPQNVDLDLACMYELTDGTRGVVQPLGKFFGDLSHPPYIKLSGDDKYGAPSGETMFINLEKKEQFKRLLIFVYIYDGTPAFASTHAVIQIIPPTGPRLEVTLDRREAAARSCAVLLIENEGGVLMARREVRYVHGFQADLDRLYGFGMQWERGYKED